jgi:hypothetical protein
MKQIFYIIVVLCLAFAQACTNASASSPIETPTAPNVSIAPGSLWVAHDEAEFILKTNQSLYYEIGGKPGRTINADVHRSNGIWVAKNPVGTEPIFSVIVYPESGTVNAYIDGAALYLNKPTGDEPQPISAQ